MATKNNTKVYTSYEDYKAIRKALEEAKEGRDWRAVKALEEQEKEAYKTLMPEVGMGATEILYSDRRAKTIVAVINANTIVVAENETKCKDYFADEYEVLETLSKMPYETYSRRKSGRWVMKGQPDSWGSVSLHLGVRVHSIDPSF